MSMRRTASALWFVAGLTWLAAPAAADSFSGFSGVDRPYLVNQDRVCTPIAVTSGAASGAPRCDKAAADVIARLSIKPPIVQSGPKAAFAAQASGRTITISRKSGAALVAWDAPDPIVKIVELYASQYEDRVALAYTVRKLGKEVTEVVAFDLGQAVGQIVSPVAPGKDPGVTPPDPASPPAVAAPEDPKVAAAVAAARAAGKPKQRAAWAAVLALDAGHPEALFHVAVVEVADKHPAEALAELATLAHSDRADAVEWLVDARFHPAFTALRADPRFRAAVGLDRKPTSAYERLMGFGGRWEQSGTSCDRPEVRFSAARDRSFQLHVKTTCEGSVYNTNFKGSWRIDGDRVVLVLPTKGRHVTVADEAGCGFEGAGDEDAMRCMLGHDLDFVVLPTRR